MDQGVGIDPRDFQATHQHTPEGMMREFLVVGNSKVFFLLMLFNKIIVLSELLLAGRVKFVVV